MWFRNLFDSLKPGRSRTPAQQARRGASRRRPVPCRPSLEALEDRLAPASLGAGHAAHVEPLAPTHHPAVVGHLSEPKAMTVLGAGPALSIGGVTLREGNNGQTAFAFTVNLSRASSRQVSVNFATADGTATVADGDYVRSAGSLTFAPGETVKTITVLVNGDTAVEPDETFFVKLSGARNASIANATGVGTILNDDAPVAVDDSNATPQYAPVSGNVLANDTNPLTGALTVSTVNGSAANVGTPIRLPSGALLTLNADGSYAYDPNGYALPFLLPEQTATDSFTYTAAGPLGTRSNTATVTITIVSSLPSMPGDPGTTCTPDNPYYPNC